MGKLISFNRITPEGFFEGENGVFDWHQADAEFHSFAIGQLEECDVLLFGRKTFALMEAIWSSAQAFETDPIVAGRMLEIPKIVVSKTKNRSDWPNTECIGEDLTEKIMALKRSEKNILMFGSATLAHSFRELGLIDEFRLMVNPVLIGSGRPFFKNTDSAEPLKLVHSKIFQSGKVLLCYTPTHTPKYRSL